MPTSSEEMTKRYEAALVELTESWNHDMERFNTEGKLKFGQENNKQSIDFVPNAVEENLEFVSLLKAEMRLRDKQTTNKILNQLRSELRECLEAEKQMKELISQISQSATRAEAIEHIMLFVLCIMRCKNRVSIKILTMNLIEGLSNYQGSKFDHLSETNGMKEREYLCIKNIKKEFNSSILGSFKTRHNGHCL